MKRFLFTAVLAAAALPAAPAMAADVGVSVSIGQPGFYGRIDIGNYPSPQLIYAEPMVIQQAPIAVVQRPIYLRVPPGHEKNWAKHCYRYGACGQPVYFVQQDWYQNVYAPRHRSGAYRDGGRHDYRRDAHRDDHRRGDSRHDGRYDRHDKDRGGKHGGRGNGKGRD